MKIFSVFNCGRLKRKPQSAAHLHPLKAEGGSGPRQSEGGGQATSVSSAGWRAVTRGRRVRVTAAGEGRLGRGHLQGGLGALVWEPEAPRPRGRGSPRRECRAGAGGPRPLTQSQWPPQRSPPRNPAPAAAPLSRTGSPRPPALSGGTRSSGPVTGGQGSETPSRLRRGTAPRRWGAGLRGDPPTPGRSGGQEAVGEVGGHWRGVRGSRRDTCERAARRDGADGRGPLKTATDPPRWRQTQGGARGRAGALARGIPLAPAGRRARPPRAPRGAPQGPGRGGPAGGGRSRPCRALSCGQCLSQHDRP